MTSHTGRFQTRSNDNLTRDNESNASKILGHKWDKREDTLEAQAESVNYEETPVTKRHILNGLGRVYDPLGIISPTMVEGKHIYKEACDEKVGWNSEVSNKISKEWTKWQLRLRNVGISRSLTREIRDRVQSQTFTRVC